MASEDQIAALKLFVESKCYVSPELATRKKRFDREYFDFCHSNNYPYMPAQQRWPYLKNLYDIRSNGTMGPNYLHGLAILNGVVILKDKPVTATTNAIPPEISTLEASSSSFNVPVEFTTDPSKVYLEDGRELDELTLEEIPKAPRNRLTDHLKEALLDIIGTHDVGEHPKIYCPNYGLARKYKSMAPLINRFLNERGYSAREVLAVQKPEPHITFRLALRTTRNK